MWNVAASCGGYVVAGKCSNGSFGCFVAGCISWSFVYADISVILQQFVIDIIHTIIHY
jgi:hypothetical protein